MKASTIFESAPDKIVSTILVYSILQVLSLNYPVNYFMFHVYDRSTSCMIISTILGALTDSA
jgi:hypothetical protein